MYLYNFIDSIYILNNSNISGRLRSLDALHFASFIAYKKIFTNTILLTSDNSLIELANEYHHEVFNPENTS